MGKVLVFKKIEDGKHNLSMYIRKATFVDGLQIGQADFVRHADPRQTNVIRCADVVGSVQAGSAIA